MGGVAVAELYAGVDVVSDAATRAVIDAIVGLPSRASPRLAAVAGRKAVQRAMTDIVAERVAPTRVISG